RKGFLEAIRQLGRPVGRLAVVVQIWDLDVLDQALDLIFAQVELHKVAIREQRERMAGRAHIGIDLIAALGGGTVVGAERPFEVPMAMRRMLLGFGGGNGFAPNCGGTGGQGGKRHGAHDDYFAHGLSLPSLAPNRRGRGAGAKAVRSCPGEAAGVESGTSGWSG